MVHDVMDSLMFPACQCVTGLRILCVGVCGWVVAYMLLGTKCPHNDSKGFNVVGTVDWVPLY